MSKQLINQRKRKEYLYRDSLLIFLVFLFPIYCLTSMFFVEKSSQTNVVKEEISSDEVSFENTFEENVPVASISFKDVNILKEAAPTQTKDISETPTTTEELSTIEVVETTVEETTPIIVEETQAQAPAPSYSEYELISLAKIIYAEAGCVFCERHAQQAAEAGITSDIWQQYVGYVFMNRVASDGFPNTIEGVLNSGGYHQITIDKFYAGMYTEECVRNAAIVLENYYNGTIPVPSNLVFQAEFPQGTTYLKVGNTYFGLSE